MAYRFTRSALSRWGSGGIAVLFATVFLADVASAQVPDSLSERYGNWVVNCETVDGGDRQCSLSQTLQREQDGGVLLRLQFTIVDGGTRMVMLAPFGVLLPANVQVVVDDRPPEELEFRTCLPSGCIVEQEPDEEFLTALQSGNQLDVGLITADTEEPLGLQLSLGGFTAAFNRLRTIQDQ